jgi:hypothetical protein
MKMPSRVSIVGCAVLAGASAVCGPAAAETATPVATYVVTTIGGSAAGTAVSHEILSLQRAGTSSRLQIAQADGSVFSTPVAYTSNGEIASNSQDGAITCYNMAVAAAGSGDSASPPPSVFVRFGASVVQIPLTVRAVQQHGSVRDIALDGRSNGLFRTANAAVDAGVVINAAIEEDGGDLRSATFDEVHYAGSPAAVVARSTCLVQRVEQHPLARAQS